MTSKSDKYSKLETDDHSFTSKELDEYKEGIEGL